MDLEKLVYETKNENINLINQDKILKLQISKLESTVLELNEIISNRDDEISDLHEMLKKASSVVDELALIFNDQRSQLSLLSLLKKYNN